MRGRRTAAERAELEELADRAERGEISLIRARLVPNPWYVGERQAEQDRQTALGRHRRHQAHAHRH